MDHGKLTDHNGKQVDFRNVILIMTTNAGAADLAKNAFGFNRTKREGDDQDAIQRMFTPEFRNRLDATIAFQNLPRDVIGKVVEKFVFQLEAQLADRSVTIELSPEATEWLIENGYDEQFGARPMARVIQEHIKQPLAEELLFGRLEGGGTVRVTVETPEEGKKKLGFEIVESRTKKPHSETDEEESGEDGDGDDGDAEAADKPGRRPPPSGGPRKPKKSPRPGGPSGDNGPRKSIVPKVPLAP
jgi:ATP-dependent Clp protease ATP-binding subunit ClpA